MSDDDGADVSSGNGSGKKDRRPELTASELLIIAALLALIEIVFGGK